MLSKEERNRQERKYYRKHREKRLNQKKEYYKLNRKELVTKYSTRLVNLTLKNKLRAIEYLGGKCIKCGFKSPYISVYDFHHIEENDKEMGIAKLLRYKWERIVKELDKCELLCANCHRITHYPKKEKENE